MREKPSVGLRKLDNDTFDCLLRLAVGDTPGRDNPFDDEEHCFIIHEAWVRGYLKVDKDLAEKWAAAKK